MKKNILMLGAGRNCLDILDIIDDINDSGHKPFYKCIGLLDDNPVTWGQTIYGVRVVGPLESAIKYKDCFFVSCIGSPENFYKKHEILSKIGIPLERFEVIIHPSATVSRKSRIGHGTVIFQNVTITSNVSIGNHILVLPNSVISHDDVINDYTCLAGGVCISGGVNIGKSCYLGTNCSVIGSVTIGNYCLVGMGSVVLSDVPENTVIAGNPARVLRHTVEP
jgi:sugar O-acyltransferase (sialic acid O-acetyltransferase NeuD family)